MHMHMYKDIRVHIHAHAYKQQKIAAALSFDVCAQILVAVFCCDEKF